MQHVTQIGDRIKLLIAENQMSTYEASKKLGYDRASKLYKLIANEVKPSYDTMLDLMKTWPTVSPDWLLKGEGPMHRGDSDGKPAGAGQQNSATIPLKRSTADAGRMPAVIAVNPDNDEEEILVVPIKAQAGYFRSGKDTDVLREHGTLKLPGFDGKTYRAFEVDGDSMEPTIGRGDFLICDFVEHWDLVKPGHVYIIETVDEFICKRLRGPLPDGKPIEMLSDNTFYEPYVIGYDRVVEIWQVRGQLTRHIPANSNAAHERMYRLMEDMARDSQLLKQTLMEITSRFAMRLVPDGL